MIEIASGTRETAVPTAGADYVKWPVVHIRDAIRLRAPGPIAQPAPAHCRRIDLGTERTFSGSRGARSLSSTEGSPEALAAGIHPAAE